MNRVRPLVRIWIELSQLKEVHEGHDWSAKIVSMGYLILGEPLNLEHGNSPLYRGVTRDEPTYCEACPKEHEINKLFRWYCDESYPSGFVHQLEKARRYAELWNTQDPTKKFEIVEVLNEDAPPVSAENFLGYDIAQGCSSLLVGGLKGSSDPVFLSSPMGILCDLLNRFYAPQLNGLFDSFSVAQQCLQAMDALQNFHPNLFEGCHLKQFFRVIALYKVMAISN